MLSDNYAAEGGVWPSTKGQSAPPAFCRDARADPW
jgi:hypothetical protein